MLKAVADKAVQTRSRKLSAVQVLLHSWLRAAVELAASARGFPHPAGTEWTFPECSVRSRSEALHGSVLPGVAFVLRCSFADLVRASNSGAGASCCLGCRGLGHGTGICRSSWHISRGMWPRLGDVLLPQRPSEGTRRRRAAVDESTTTVPPARHLRTCWTTCWTRTWHLCRTVHKKTVLVRQPDVVSTSCPWLMEVGLVLVVVLWKRSSRNSSSSGSGSGSSSSSSNSANYYTY